LHGPHAADQVFATPPTCPAGGGGGGKGGVFEGKRFRKNRFVFLVLFQTSASPAATAVTAVNVAAAGTEVAVAAVVLRRTRRGVQDALFQRAA